MSQQQQVQQQQGQGPQPACGMQWSTLTTLCRSDVAVKDGVNELYGRITFPYKIRCHFAIWIESQSWSEIDTDTESGERKAESLYRELLMKLDDYVTQISSAQAYDLERTLDWRQTKDSLRKAFDGNYVTFVHVVRDCLEREQELIRMVLNENSSLRHKHASGATVASPDDLRLRQHLAELQQQIVIVETTVQEVMRKQSEFLAEYQEQKERMDKLCNEIRVEPSAELSAMKDQLERGINRQILENFKRRNDMAQGCLVLARQLDDALRLVWGEIDAWHQEQKLIIACLATSKPGALDTLDRLCEEAGSMLIRLILQVHQALEVMHGLSYASDQRRADLEALQRGLSDDILRKHMQQ